MDRFAIGRLVDEFTHLESTISSNRSLDKEIERRIGEAVSTVAHLRTRVCEKTNLLKIVEYIYFLYLFSEKADWNIMDELDTNYSCTGWMWTTNYIHDASSTQTALTGTCLTNEKRKNPQRYLVYYHCW